MFKSPDSVDITGRHASVQPLLDRRVEAASVNCTVRLIKETVEVFYQRRGRNSRQYVCDQLYEEKLTVALAPGADGRQTPRVEFHLPEGDYSTRLSGDEPRYRLFEAEGGRWGRLTRGR